MAIFSLGRFDKKLFLIAFIFIIRTAFLVAKREGYGLYQNDLMDLEEEISSIMIGIVMHFILKDKQVKQNSTRKSKKGFKYIIVLFFLKVILGIRPIFDHSQIIITSNGVTIIFMTLITFLLLKYKYYIHHIITIVLYCALGISIDAIIGNFYDINLKSYFLCLLWALDEAMLYCYMKYMMDKLYYKYTEVIIYYGISGLITKACVIIGMGVYQCINGNKGIFNSISNYFKTINPAVIIFLQFLYFIIHFCIDNLLKIIIIYYLRPNHIIINDQLNIFEEIIIYLKIGNKKYYTIIPFVFQILCLLFYFEILELNFCNLNKNTVKNIQAREKLQEYNEPKPSNSFKNKIELVDQYYLVENESEFKDEETNDNNKDNKTYNAKVIE